MANKKIYIYMGVLNTSICMHDDAPCHRLKVGFKYLTKRWVAVLDPPRNSPDFNPIKNLCSYLKNKVAEKQPSSATELVTAMIEVWIKKSAQNIANS